ncbi:MAG: hypothetical protein ACKV2V_20565, partial [Blastocatellia bacterium]
PVPVVTVSAITFATTDLAPQSLAAAFGTQLATSTVAATTTVLPTTLGGTTVTVNGVPAPLFLVSPGQINYQMPASIMSGVADVVVTAADGTVSRGTALVRDIAPLIITANSGGAGPPNGQAIHDHIGGFRETLPLAQFNAAAGVFVTRPVDLGPLGDQVFVSLFLTGTRLVPDTDGNPLNGAVENIRVVIGGIEITPAFLGPAPGFTGLEQLNFLLPRELIGRGLLTLAVSAGGIGSNLTEIEIAGSPAGLVPAISAVTPTTDILAGQTISLSGAFAGNAAGNTVRISGFTARVLSSAPGILTAQVPFGSQSGQVSVTTAAGQAFSAATLAMRTSVSGYVENTGGAPLGGVTIRQPLPPRVIGTAADGSFVLADPNNGATVLEFDGGTIPGVPTYPAVTLKKIVTSNRDNTFDRPVTIQANTGEQIILGGDGDVPSDAEPGDPQLQDDSARRHGPMASPVIAQQPGGGVIEGMDGGIVFRVPRAHTALFPNGATRGSVIVTKVAGNRTPVNLPPNVFSSSIIQIAPFGVIITPGAKLIFPNSEGLPAGAKVTLYQLDQTRFIAGTGGEGKTPAVNQTLGSFIPAGTAMVSADGKTVETADNAITVTGMYFAGAPRQSTTIAGRVFDCQCTPGTRISVRARGHEVFVDGNGGFVLRYVPVTGAQDLVTVTVSLLRANLVMQTISRDLRPTPGGMTFNDTDFVFSPEKCPVAYNQLVMTTKDKPLTFRLNVRGMGGDSSPQLPPPDGGERALQYIIVQEPRCGRVKLGFNNINSPAVGPVVTYTPFPGYVGNDKFVYKVSNGCRESEPVMVIIQIKPAPANLPVDP